VYNIFDQNPAAETVFPEGDVRRNYFHGDRMKKTVDRVEAMRKEIEKISNGKETDLASVSLRFVLRSTAVATTIPGMRSIRQAEMNAAVSDQPPLSDELYAALKKHFWYRNFWLD
jgi:aryl-alcohol dehydrogenase-like predicted oxidoreductase